jgi:hypothetical protein
MKNPFEDFPDHDLLLEWYGKNGSNLIHPVNSHFHTPYSYSAFENMNELFTMAVQENVNILGINDFYTSSGFDEFTDLCLSNSKFPLYNIEFIGLLKSEQEKGIRINDPNNPGRIYFCGKGLDYPVDRETQAMKLIEKLADESQFQIKQMIEKTSDHLVQTDGRLNLDYNEILEMHTNGMVRERHVAKAIRIKIFNLFKTIEERKAILNKIFEGNEITSNLNNNAETEEEIRSKILKSGGKGYVREDNKAFLELNEIIKIIIDSGGIPTYPVLCDDKSDLFTEFERDPESLLSELSSRNIYSIELIPRRNSLKRIREYCEYFHDRKFIVTFGTEHNTPEIVPLKVSSRGGVPIGEELESICFEGACVIAAHQYLRSRKLPGYIDGDGLPKIKQLDEFIELGNAVIEYFLQNRSTS